MRRDYLVINPFHKTSTFVLGDAGVPVKGVSFIAAAAFGAFLGASGGIHEPRAAVAAEVGAQGVAAVGRATQGWKEKEDCPQTEGWAAQDCTR